MVKGRLKGKDGTDVLLIGLSGQTVARLLDGEALRLDAGDLGLPQLGVLILGGASDAALVRQARAMPGMDLVVSDDGQPVRPGPDRVANAVVAVRDKWPDMSLREAERMVQVAVDAAWARAEPAA